MTRIVDDYLVRPFSSLASDPLKTEFIVLEPSSSQSPHFHALPH